MLTNTCQRWREGRPAYRLAREAFSPRHHEVAPIEQATAKAFVRDHHYERTYPADRYRFGLMDRAGNLVGTAVFAVPFRGASLDVLPCDRAEGVVLSRFVLLDHVLANAESWFLARCFEALRAEGIEGVVSFSDPLARSDRDGNLVMPGHVGVIYQATNATYVGQTKPEWRHLYDDGRMVQTRSLAKIRRRDQGRRYAADQLVAMGAQPLPDDASSEDATAWVRHWLEKLCRRVKHPGNHKYAWMLQRKRRRHLPPSRPYPKVIVPQLSLQGVA
jgi:hypothetical protein